MASTPPPGTRVLVVEDDADIREALVETLGDAGFEVDGASNGRAALEWLRRAPSPPAVILLDRRMPILDGAGFREEQLRNPAWASIPVVLLSADPSEISLSGVAVVTKPVLPEVLVDVVLRAAAAR